MARHSAYLAGGVFIFNHWRCPDLKEISRPGERCASAESLVHLIESNPFVLCTEMAIRAVYDFMELEPQL